MELLLKEETYQIIGACYEMHIVELTVLTALTTQHEAQLINYLKATGSKGGLLGNFG